MADSTTKEKGGQSQLSCGMALLTNRRSFFLAVFAATLTLLITVVPPWLITWPALAIIAAYLANWGVELAAVKMPSTFVPDIEKHAVLVTGKRENNVQSKFNIIFLLNKSCDVIFKFTYL